MISAYSNSSDAPHSSTLAATARHPDRPLDLALPGAILGQRWCLAVLYMLPRLLRHARQPAIRRMRKTASRTCPNHAKPASNQPEILGFIISVPRLTAWMTRPKGAKPVTSQRCASPSKSWSAWWKRGLRRPKAAHVRRRFPFPLRRCHRSQGATPSTSQWR